MTVDPRIPALLDRVATLTYEADRLIHAGRPWIVRMWHARRAWDMLAEAGDLLDEVNRLQGIPVTTPPPQVLLGMGHAGWTRLQWAVGIFHACAAWWAIDAGRPLAATFSILCLQLCRYWSIPRKPITITKAPAK